MCEIIATKREPAQLARDLRVWIVPGFELAQMIEYLCPDPNTRFPLTISVGDNRNRFDRNRHVLAVEIDGD